MILKTTICFGLKCLRRRVWYGIRIWSQFEWRHLREKVVSWQKEKEKYFGERKRVSKAAWKIQRENTHLRGIKWLYLHDGIIICQSNFSKSYSYPGIGERDRKREPVFCGSLNSLRSLLLGFQKLRNQWSSGSNFFEKFQNLRTSVFMSQNQKNPRFLIFKKIQRIDGSHERTTKEPAV